MNKFSISIVLSFIFSVMASAVELKILSWNLYLIPKPIVFNHQLARTHQISDYLKTKDYDVIVFQELFSLPAIAILKNKLHKMYPYIQHLGGHFPKILNSGVMVLSKHPFNTLDKLYYKNCATTDCFASKGSLLVEFQHVSGNKIQLAATHTQAWDTSKAVAARRKQMMELRSFLDRHQISGVSQFLVGDLNVDGFAGQEFYDLQRLVDMNTINLSGAEEDRTWGYNVDCSPKARPSKERAWLDHVWMRTNGAHQAEIVHLEAKPVKAMIFGKCEYLSDHHGLEAHIRF